MSALTDLRPEQQQTKNDLKLVIAQTSSTHMHAQAAQAQQTNDLKLVIAQTSSTHVHARYRQESVAAADAGKESVAAQAQERSLWWPPTQDRSPYHLPQTRAQHVAVHTCHPSSDIACILGKAAQHGSAGYRRHVGEISKKAQPISMLLWSQISQDSQKPLPKKNDTKSQLISINTYQYRKWYHFLERLKKAFYLSESNHLPPLSDGRFFVTCVLFHVHFFV